MSQKALKELSMATSKERTKKQRSSRNEIANALKGSKTLKNTKSRN